jgi:excisionase family DNA binding protein
VSHLSIADICRHLKVSRWTVYRLIDARELQATKVGPHVEVSEASYLTFLDRHTVPANDRTAR